MKINKIFCNKKNKQAGLSMVEIGLVFTVIAVAVAGVMYAYNSVVKAQKYDTTVNQIVNLGAGELAALAETSYKRSGLGVSELVSEGYMPSVGKINGQNWVNPFGLESTLYRSYIGSSLFTNDNGVYHGQFRVDVHLPDKQTCVRFAGMLKNNLKVGRLMPLTYYRDGAQGNGCYSNSGDYYVCVAFNSDGLGSAAICAQ